MNIDDLPLDDGAEIARLMQPLHVALVEDAWEEAMGQLGLSFAFDLDNPFIQDVLDQLAAQVRNVADTTRDDIRSAVGRAADEGWSAERLARRLEEMADVNSASRASMIARTELARAQSLGSVAAWQASGVVASSEWLTFEPCPICAPLEGQVAALGAAFAEGITHPPAHPNCRCALAPIVEA